MGGAWESNRDGGHAVKELYVTMHAQAVINAIVLECVASRLRFGFDAAGAVALPRNIHCY